MPLTRVDIEKFNKVLIVYNQNSGKQVFANMFARVNEIYKRIKSILGAKRTEIVDIKKFADLDSIADRVAVTMATVEVASSWADLRDRQLH